MALNEEDKQWIRTEMRIESNEIRQDLRNAIHDLETRILTAFHQWASPAEARQRSHAAHLRTHDVEIENLADRVKALEEKH